MSLPFATFDEVKAAAARIAPFVVTTPLVESPALSSRSGRRVFLKLETLQFTGSFKYRGACNRLILIPPAQRPAGVVAFSSGNHGQAVAAAAREFGLKAVIVMPSDAPRAKMSATRAFGPEIILYDRQRDDREAIATEICNKRQATLIRPFDDLEIIAGQGSVGLEIQSSLDALDATIDAVLVPCGGGGLVSGIALSFSASESAARPRIYTVEPENFASMRVSLERGERSLLPAAPPSIADSLMAPIPGSLTFAIASRYVAGGLTVSDGEIITAMSYAARQLKLIVEPGGSAGLAALLAAKLPPELHSVAIVLSGANVDCETIADACVRIPDP